MERDRLDQASLNRGVDVECTGHLDRFVLGIEHWVNLTEPHAFNDYFDLNEIAAVGLEVGQAVEAGDVPCRGGTCLPELCNRKRPAEVLELTFLLHVLGR